MADAILRGIKVLTILLIVSDEVESETEGKDGDNNEGNQPSDLEEDLSGHTEQVGGVSEALQKMNNSGPYEEGS